MLNGRIKRQVEAVRGEANTLSYERTSENFATRRNVRITFRENCIGGKTCLLLINETATGSGARCGEYLKLRQRAC